MTSTSPNKNELREYYSSNKINSGQKSDFYNIFKQEKSIQQYQNSENQIETTFRYNKSKLAYHKNNNILSSKKLPRISKKSRTEMKEERPSNLKNLPSPISQPKIALKKVKSSTNINMNQINTLDKGISELEQENEKLSLQLREALKMIKKERERFKEIEKSHIKLENLAKELQSLGIKEKQRADRLEAELIRMSQKGSSAKKRNVDVQRELDFAVQSAIEETEMRKESEFEGMRQNMKILIEEYDKLKLLRESDAPNVENMKQIVHLYQKKIM